MMQEGPWHCTAASLAPATHPPAFPFGQQCLLSWWASGSSGEPPSLSDLHRPLVLLSCGTVPAEHQGTAVTSVLKNVIAAQGVVLHGAAQSSTSGNYLPLVVAVPPRKVTPALSSGRIFCLTFYIARHQRRAVALDIPGAASAKLQMACSDPCSLTRHRKSLGGDACRDWTTVRAGTSR